MAANPVAVVEARNVIHQSLSGWGLPRLLIPVLGTTWWVEVGDVCNGRMIIFTSRPAYIPASQALSVWGDQPITELIIHTGWADDDEYGPPHMATREEWESFLHYLSWRMPTMSGDGKINILDHSESINWLDELLDCLPPTLPHLVANCGVRRIKLTWGMVTGRAVLAFLAALHQEGLPVEAANEGCIVRTPGHVEVCLHQTWVTGDRLKTLSHPSLAC